MESTAKIIKVFFKTKKDYNFFKKTLKMCMRKARKGSEFEYNEEINDLGEINGTFKLKEIKQNSLF